MYSGKWACLTFLLVAYSCYFILHTMNYCGFHNPTMLLYMDPWCAIVPDDRIHCLQIAQMPLRVPQRYHCTRGINPEHEWPQEMVNKVVRTSLFAELLLLCEWKKYIHSTQTCSELEADNNAIQSQEQSTSSTWAWQLFKPSAQSLKPSCETKTMFDGP